ncbi:MAG: hypothetical protein R2761_23270 [Acidimicrobiales bacterium]
MIRFGRRWIGLACLGVGTIILVVLQGRPRHRPALVDYPLGGLSFWIRLPDSLHPWP